MCRGHLHTFVIADCDQPFKSQDHLFSVFIDEMPVKYYVTLFFYLLYIHFYLRQKVLVKFEHSEGIHSPNWHRGME